PSHGFGTMAGCRQSDRHLPVLLGNNIIWLAWRNRRGDRWRGRPVVCDRLVFPCEPKHRGERPVVGAGIGSVPDPGGPRFLRPVCALGMGPSSLLATPGLAR